MSNGTIGGSVPGSQDQLIRRVTDLERRVREIASSRSLGTSSIDSGGITVNPDGVAVALRVEQYDGSLGGNPGPAGTLAFWTAVGLLSRLRLIDATAPAAAVTLLESVPDSAGGTAALSMSPTNGVQFVVPGTGGTTLTIGNSGSTYGPGLNVYTGGKIFTVDPGGTIGFNGLQLRSTGAEWRAQDVTDAYVPVRASSFPTSSSRGQKQNVTDLPFDPVAAIETAPAHRWQYKPSQAADDRFHISPMADDLPAELVEGAGADMNVDTRDLVGVLWAAVGQQQKQIDALTARVSQLEGAA